MRKTICLATLGMAAAFGLALAAAPASALVTGSSLTQATTSNDLMLVAEKKKKMAAKPRKRRGPGKMSPNQMEKYKQMVPQEYQQHIPSNIPGMTK
jgi:hypothetical protein